MPQVKHLTVNKKECQLEYSADEKETLPKYFCHDFQSYTMSNNDSLSVQLDVKS